MDGLTCTLYEPEELFPELGERVTFSQFTAEDDYLLRFGIGDGFAIAVYDLAGIGLCEIVMPEAGFEIAIPAFGILRPFKGTMQ